MLSLWGNSEPSTYLRHALSRLDRIPSPRKVTPLLSPISRFSLRRLGHCFSSTFVAGQTKRYPRIASPFSLRHTQLHYSTLPRHQATDSVQSSQAFRLVHLHHSSMPKSRRNGGSCRYGGGVGANPTSNSKHETRLGQLWQIWRLIRSTLNQRSPRSQSFTTSCFPKCREDLASSTPC